MVTLRTSSMDMEDQSGGRARKMPRGPPDSGMGMPPINAGPRGRAGPPMGVGPPLPGAAATSNRGRRSGARSPIVAVSGGSGPVPGRRPGSPNGRPSSGDRRGMHGKVDNPSSAAAAAAAAAKAFSDGNSVVPMGLGRENPWPDRHMDDRGYPPMAPGYGDKGPYRRGPGSGKWPPNRHEDPKMSGHYSQHTYGPYGPYDGYHGYDSRYRGSDRAHPPHYPYKDMRGGAVGPDGVHRGSGPDAGQGPMYHHQQHGNYHHRTYMGGSGRVVDGRRPPPPQPPHSSAGASTPTGSRMGRNTPNTGGNTGAPTGGGGGGGTGGAGGGTSLVIGGTTPIHVPKREVHPDLPERPERPNRAMTRPIFRGCDNSDTAPPLSAADDEANQRKMLLSFKTPTSSFEEKKGEDSKRPASSGQQLSPRDPPQLHNTTSQRAADVFELQRNHDGNKNAPGIDIAPSFALFSQSFDDSLGENYLTNVESTLHADSFGIPPTASTGGEGEGMTNVLRSAFSGGNGSTQLLAPSMSGHLSIGYSPVNSFGTAPPPRREGSGGQMILLGGTEGGSSSPTQVFSAYNQGYSGNRTGPLEDSHFRMSVGSFGAQSYSRPGPYLEPTSSHGYNGPTGGGSGEKIRHDGSPFFYIFLKKYKLAFAGCSFLLPGLKTALLEQTKDNNTNKNESDSPDLKNEPPRYSHTGDPTPQDLVIAQRRVESSVCAFGGSIGGKETTVVTNEPSASSSSQGSSIFRDREKPSPEQPTATVTPSSSVSSPPRQSSNPSHKTKYEEELPGRYYENDSRLSWEFEENPPVEIPPNPTVRPDSKNSQEKRDSSKASDDVSISSKRLGAISPHASKMRYRCKLCGQPKQNHICPYQQSLARSIGIMVYPAVNAFTAAEPGTIAPALSEMNNFTDLSERGSVAHDSSPGRSGLPLTSPKQVTPESARPSPRQLQVGSPPTTPGRTPVRSNAGLVRRNGPSRGQKRPHGYDGSVPEDQGDLLFVEAMELKPQQFLTVSDSPEGSSPDAFSYLPLPLPYAQRKRLSDNLFSLSNEVPKLTDECAQVLREAREKDKWDLAVAELMTQVIVVLHCRDGDHRFEGLRQYLLTLGIAC